MKRMCRPTRPLSWPTITLRAWRSRQQYPRLLAAFRAERTKALDDTRRENERRQADTNEDVRIVVEV